MNRELFVELGFRYDENDDVWYKDMPNDNLITYAQRSKNVRINGRIVRGFSYKERFLELLKAFS